MYEEESAPQVSARSYHSNIKLQQCPIYTVVVLQIIFPARNIKPVLWHIYIKNLLLYNIWMERQQCNMQSHMTWFTVLPSKNLYYQHHMGDHQSSFLKFLEFPRQVLNPSLSLFLEFFLWGLMAVQDCILPSFLLCVYRLPPSGTEIRV